MRITLRLLVIAVLAAFGASLGVGVSRATAAVVHVESADHASRMAHCDGCLAEQMDEGAIACGTICASPGAAVLEPQATPQATARVQKFFFADHDLTGQIRRPELNPP